jgi:hypothetical protein
VLYFRLKKIENNKHRAAYESIITVTCKCDFAVVDNNKYLLSEYLFDQRRVFLEDLGTIAFVYDKNCDTIGMLGGFAGNTKVNGRDLRMLSLSAKFGDASSSENVSRPCNTSSDSGLLSPNQTC